MSKRISEFPLASALLDSDFLATVQDGANYKVTGNILKTSLAEDFASISQLDGFTDEFTNLVNKVDDNYLDLSGKITAGDNTVSRVLNNTIISYYDNLNDEIITIETGHNADILHLGNTIQSWINTIDSKVDKESITNLLNRLTVSENLLTQLSEIVYNYTGNATPGTGGGTPGYHTQSTATIFPLSGYYLTGAVSSLATTDSLNQALAKLEGRLHVVETTGGGGTGGGSQYLIKVNDQTQATDGNIYSAARSDVNYLSKKNNDTAAGKITFLQGIQAGPIFSEGFLGTGAALFKNGTKWKLEVDELFVRGGLTVNELIVNEIKAIGGEVLVSVADMEVVSVDVADAQGVYRCYFDDQDGTIANKFEVYDQAICQKFDGKNIKRYWRLVTAVGSNFIELSMTDFEPGSGIPEEGDKILQLGNRNDSTRRSAIMISAKGTDGPTIKMYDNIYEYSLENKERTVLGKTSKFVGTIQVTDQTGDAFPVPVDKGAYVTGNTYYYYDRVSYDGSLWLCMAISTTDAPDVNEPDVWLQQVARGQTGTSGSDVGKWTRIMGDGLFFYNDSSFSGIPNPTSLILTCETFNLANPVYKWINTVDNSILGTAGTLTLSYTVLGNNRQILIRCEVTDGDDIFVDEAQVGKVANGNDSYLVRLDNQTMTAPYDAVGENPMIDLINIYSNIEVYRGTTKLEINSVTSNVLSGTATITIARQSPDRWRATWESLTTDSARILLTITTTSGVFTTELVMYKNFAGEPGIPGVDAGAVVVTGPNMFVVDPIGGNTTPTEITLTVSSYSISQPSIKWYWSYVNEYSWQEIEGQTASTIVIGPDMYGFNAGATNELIFKASVTSGSTDIAYEDWITIAKVKNGIDGEGSYIATLSNENHSVPADYLGIVDSTETIKAKTSYMLMRGTTEMSSSEYTVTLVNLDATDTSTANLDTTNKTVTLSSFDITKDSTIWKIEFRVGGNIVSVKDFTISKTKGGAPGDYDVLIYTRQITANNPSRPTFTSIPSSSGGLGPDNNVWYTNIPSGTPIWMTKARFSGKTNSGISTNGYIWSVPTKITGTNGVNGATGQPGSPGQPGSTGAQGATGAAGPSMNFRGEYQTNTYYYMTQYTADAVRYNNVYYIRINSNYNSTSTVPTNTSYWYRMNSFANIATGLLLANEATIAGWVFAANWIRSANSNVFLDGRTPSGSVGQYPIAVGSGAATSPANAAFSVSSAGVLKATGGNFSGGTIIGGTISGSTISGVTGSFRRLSIENTSGTAVGSISFVTEASSPCIDFNGINIMHQGPNLKFIANSVHVRGGFGANSLNTIVVLGTTGRYYQYGLSNTSYTTIAFSSSNGSYVIPLYGQTGTITGVPFDLVIFNTSGSYSYIFSASAGKRITAINSYDTNSGISVRCNGVSVPMIGGSYRDFTNIGSLAYPSTSSYVGGGWFAGPSNDNTWT